MSDSEDEYDGLTLTDGDLEKSCETENNEDVDSYYREQSHTNNDSDGGAKCDSDDDLERERNELALLREANIKQTNEFLKMLMSDPEYADVVTTAKELKQPRVRKNKNNSEDPTFKSGARYPKLLERRRSGRLQNIPPIFSKEDLIDETDFNRKRKRDDDDYFDLEAVVYQPKRSRVSTQNSVRHDIIPVEDVTDKMIENIARKGTVKVYSDSGTSCHQCRQKTMDQKTCCRNTNCVGVRGQFCGVCLENRYGEDAGAALKDPQWNCPVCREICNCSFCRLKAGKRPTGILAPLAQQNGHKSVKDFLESLKGEGDYAHQDSLWQKLNDPKSLLGFSNDKKFAHMGGNTKHEIKVPLDLNKLKTYIGEKERELESIKDNHDEPRSLLGFFEGTNVGLLDDGTRCCLEPSYTLLASTSREGTECTSASKTDTLDSTVPEENV